MSNDACKSLRTREDGAESKWYEKKAKGVGVREVCYCARNRLMGVKTTEVAQST